jgi:hypothetical protein
MYKNTVKFLITVDDFDLECEAADYIDRRKRNYFLKSISRKILINQINKFWFYQKITRESNIDFTRVSLLLIRYVAQYETDSNGINTKCLISAADNNYNSYRYYIYKKNGIKDIALIQNGYRTGGITSTHGDLYTYSDFYFGFGNKQIAIQSNMMCPNKIPIGSIFLYNLVNNLGGVDKDSYDVIFIESFASENNDYFNMETYLKIIENLSELSRKNPSLKIYYRKRNKPIPELRKDLFINLYNNLEENGVIVDIGLEKNSYEAMQKSKVIVYYRTTMGTEGLALNKFVLNCNYDGDTFPISKSEEIGVLIDPSYGGFERKIMHILRNLESPEFEEYFDAQRLQYMNMDLNHKDPNRMIYEELLKKH